MTMQKEKLAGRPPVANTVQQIPPSGIRKYFDMAAKMQDVISLGVGEPDFSTPWSIREAAIHSIERGQTAYTSTWGMPELRQSVSKHLQYLYNIEYNPESEILITAGVSEAMDLAMRAILNPGDEVIVAEPCFVSYKSCVLLAGGVPVVIKTSADNGFGMTIEAIEKVRTPRLKAILVGYPSNPTGSTMDAPELQKIVDYARKHGLFLISDEIYDRLVYEGKHTCVASLPGACDRTILLNGFSKSYAMTGWRVGYACGPKDVIGAMMKIHSFTMICVSTMGQKAAIEALAHGEHAVQNMIRQYNQRRLLMVNGFNEMGLKCHTPKGAFYAFPSVASTGLTCEELTERLLFDEKVAVVPGSAFGETGAPYIRCSYATSLQNIGAALGRISHFLESMR